MLELPKEVAILALRSTKYEPKNGLTIDQFENLDGLRFYLEDSGVYILNIYLDNVFHDSAYYTHSGGTKYSPDVAYVNVIEDRMDAYMDTPQKIQSSGIRSTSIAFYIALLYLAMLTVYVIYSSLTTGGGGFAS